MFLKNLELKNYRNYKHAQLNFDKGTILITGDNGQGKTNLLESIYYLSCGKSHRGSSTREIIHAQENFALMRAEAVAEDGKKRIEIELRREGNDKIRVDKVYRKKKSEFINIMPAVVFSPDDLSLVKGGPSFRRSYLDGILDRAARDFPGLRLRYQKTLAQRNSLINSMTHHPHKINTTLKVWTEKLISYGTTIMAYRMKLVEAIKDDFASHMDYFFGGSDALMGYMASWQQQPESLEDVESQYRKHMEKNLKKDLAMATTTIGPHRDEIILNLEGRNLRNYGSQGQQRLAALSMRLCELMFLFQKMGKSPLFLLDDVLSELDLLRKKLLIEKLGDRFQTMITATNIHYLEGVDIDICGKYVVSGGSVQRL